MLIDNKGLDDVSTLTKANQDKLLNVYRLVCKVMDVAIYNSGKQEEANRVLPVFKSESDSNSNLIREATGSVILALVREKYSV